MRSFAFLVAVGLTFSPALAQTSYTWTDAALGDSHWSTPANWSPAGVPGPGDTATVPSPSAVFLSANVTVARLVLLAGYIDCGSYTLEITSRLEWRGGRLEGPGEVIALGGADIGDPDAPANHVLDLVDVPLSLGGSSLLASRGGGVSTYLRLWGAARVLVAPSATLRASAGGAPNELSLLVEKSPGGRALVVEGEFMKAGPAEFRFNNSGLEVSPSGALVVEEGNLAVNPLSPGALYLGAVGVWNGASLTLQPGAHTVGGGVSGEGALIVQAGTVQLVPGVSLDDLGELWVQSGLFSLPSGADLALGGRLRWSGGVVAGPATLSVRGGALFSGSPVLRGATLVLDSDALVGDGSVGFERLGSVDAGLVVAGGQTLVLRSESGQELGRANPSNLPTLVVHGTLRKEGPGYVRLLVETINEGEVDVAEGLLYVAERAEAPFSNQPDGVVGGDGELWLQPAGFTNLGALAPGLRGGTGEFAVTSGTGSWAIPPTASLDIELAGDAAYDRLVTPSALSLAGRLRVSLLGGYVPEVGRAFEVLRTGGRTGDFSAYEGLDLPAGRVLVPSFVGNGLVLTVAEGDPPAPDTTPPVCGPITLDHSGPGGALSAIVSSASDPESGIASARFTSLANLLGYVDGAGPYAQGDTHTTPDPNPASVALRGERISYAAGGRLVVRVTNGAGLWRDCDPVVAQLSATAPEAFSLEPAYPNPARLADGPVHLAFGVAEASSVSVVVYDLVGREVARLVDGPMEPGRYEVAWAGADAAQGALAAGVYVVRMEAGAFRHTHRLTLVN